MFEVNIKVDLQNSSDMQRALEFILNQPCMSRFKETYYNKSSYLTGNLAGNSRNNQELIDKIKELEKEIQKHKKENEKNQKLLSDKDVEIEKFQQSLEEQTKKFDEENKKNNELESGWVKALDEKEKIEEEAKSQLETLKKEYTLPFHMSARRIAASGTTIQINIAIVELTACRAFSCSSYTIYAASLFRRPLPSPISI